MLHTHRALTPGNQSEHIINGSSSFLLLLLIHCMVDNLTMHRGFASSWNGHTPPACCTAHLRLAEAYSLHFLLRHWLFCACLPFHFLSNSVRPPKKDPWDFNMQAPPVYVSVSSFLSSHSGHPRLLFHALQTGWHFPPSSKHLPQLPFSSYSRIAEIACPAAFALDSNPIPILHSILLQWALLCPLIRREEEKK